MIALIVGFLIFFGWSAFSTQIFKNKIKGLFKKTVKIGIVVENDKDSANKKTPPILKT
jgi:hypothetical protein